MQINNNAKPNNNPHRKNTLKNQSDVRFETSQEPTALFPQNENPCFNIYKISLLDYSTDNNFSLSQFSLELNKSVKDLKIKLPLCISTDGINVLVKTIQNKIIEKGYVTTRVVVPEKSYQW